MIKYRGKFYTDDSYVVIADEMLANAKKRRYYQYGYDYERHNPQTGVHEHSGYVIAKTDAEAMKLAKKPCAGGVYGWNKLIGLNGEKKPLKYGEDYTLSVEKEWVGFGDYKPVIKVRTVFH